MSDALNFAILSWGLDEAKIKSFSTASRRDGSILKIELLVNDPYLLGSLISRLQEAQRDQDKKPEKQKPTPRSNQKAELLALPAPALRLPDGRPKP